MTANQILRPRRKLCMQVLRLRITCWNGTLAELNSEIQLPTTITVIFETQNSFTEKLGPVRRDSPTATLASFVFKSAGAVKEIHVSECKDFIFNMYFFILIHLY